VGVKGSVDQRFKDITVQQSTDWLKLMRVNRELKTFNREPDSFAGGSDQKNLDSKVEWRFVRSRSFNQPGRAPGGTGRRVVSPRAKRL
jgi:hypothetical protein